LRLNINRPHNFKGPDILLRNPALFLSTHYILIYYQPIEK
jgi:hypothetical protein